MIRLINNGCGLGPSGNTMSNDPIHFHKSFYWYYGKCNNKIGPFKDRLSALEHCENYYTNLEKKQMKSVKKWFYSKGIIFSFTLKIPLSWLKNKFK